MATDIQSTTQKMSARQLDWDLLEELECPVCLEYMASPIKMCENGHNICDSCRESLSECPTCRGNLVNVRNITLEKFAAKAIYPCRNVKDGCKETFTLDDKDSHLAVCLFQSRECPFRKLSGVDCPWTGVLSDVVVHILAEHDSETAEVPANFRMELLDFVVGNRYRKVVMLSGELFYLIWETEGDVLRFGVFHFGPKNESSDFKYGIKIGNSDVYVAVTRKCQNYLDGGLKDIQPWNCVTLHFGTTQERLGEHGEFSCEIEIGKWKLDGFVSDDKLEYMPIFYATCNSEPNSGSRASAEEVEEQQQQQQQECQQQ
jgi:hypothetical protein